MNAWFAACLSLGALAGVILGAAYAFLDLGRPRTAALLLANAGAAALAALSARAFHPSLNGAVAGHPRTVIGALALAFLALGMGLSGRESASVRVSSGRRYLILSICGFSSLLTAGILVAAAAAPAGALGLSRLVPGLVLAVSAPGWASCALFRRLPETKAGAAVRVAGLNLIRGGVYLLALAAVSPQAARMDGVEFQPLSVVSPWTMAVIFTAAASVAGFGFWRGKRRGLAG